MSVPVGLVGESFVDAVVEVLVVGEDDMAADIVELGGGRALAECAQKAGKVYGHTKPSGVMSVEARPPGMSVVSMIIHDGPS